MYRPYVIVKTCYHGERHCKAKLKYAPGQHSGLAGSGTYFYQKARKGKHGDFVLLHKKRHHHHAHGYKAKKRVSRHAKETHRRDWCRKHVWGFDTLTGTFAGGVPHRVRCAPSYDRR